MPPPLILFDGVCNYCNSVVNLVIRQDRSGRIRFAPLQSGSGRRMLEQYGIPDTLESFVFIKGGKAYQRSTAVLRVVHELPWYWQWGRIGWLLPRFIRDAVYNFIARNRYRWFGRSESCMIPSPEVRNRFLTGNGDF
ncbi:MAG TPA: thiol-disulfide oxidoreductase DCC family protein [Chitinophagaceae bacterium]|jgi:predicted DCC family thiol-disulfide oxidoreductase YuxK|nr:thiol-disulfide oxidoreductase DCC family protein [Chitinophagaceae bacterium]